MGQLAFVFVVLFVWRSRYKMQESEMDKKLVGTGGSKAGKTGATARHLPLAAQNASRESARTQAPVLAALSRAGLGVERGQGLGNGRARAEAEHTVSSPGKSSPRVPSTRNGPSHLLGLELEGGGLYKQRAAHRSIMPSSLDSISPCKSLEENPRKAATPSCDSSHVIPRDDGGYNRVPRGTALGEMGQVSHPLSASRIQFQVPDIPIRRRSEMPTSTSLPVCHSAKSPLSVAVGYGDTCLLI